MIMCRIWVLIVLLIAVLPVSVFAADRYFVLSSGAWSPRSTSTIDANLKTINTSYDTGWLVSGTYGIGFDSGFRLENELAWRQASAKQSTGDMWQLGWLFNLWYDFKNYTPVTPYLGGGFGYSRAHTASQGIVDETAAGVMWQVGGGLDIGVSERVSFDLGYKYSAMVDLTSNTSAVAVNPSGSAFVGGVKIKF